MKVIQSQSFPQENQNKMGKVALALLVGSTALMADDPAWYTGLVTTLTWIATAVVSVLGIVIGIRLAPLAWIHIKRVLYR